MKRWSCFGVRILISFLLLFLTGCGAGNGEEDAEAKTESNTPQTYYRIQETAIPDPDTALAEELTGNGWVRELDMQFAEGRLYRLAQAWGTVDGIEQTTGYYLQILEEPYSAWENDSIPSKLWDDTLEYEGWQYQPEKIAAVTEKEIYLVIQKIEMTGGQIQQVPYLGSLRLCPKEGIVGGAAMAEEGLEGTLLGVLPDEVKEENLYRSREGIWYSYRTSGSKITMLDELLQVKEEKRVAGKIDGLLDGTGDGGVLWYGIREDSFGIWTTDNAAAFAGELPNTDTYYLVTEGENGSFYGTDTKGIWKAAADTEPVRICSFFENGYILDEVQAIRVLDEDRLELLVRLDGSRALLHMVKQEGVQAKKEEIVLALGDENPLLMDYVSKFNRRSETYRVTVRLHEANETGQEFIDKLQMELAAGRGPDLLMNGQIDAADMARNGYLQELTDIFDDGDGFWTAAMECGKIDGVTYGIPYAGQLFFSTYSQKLTGGRESWTIREFMQAVKASDAEILQYGLSGADIVFYYGLLDNENAELIDWANGESHLTEDLFLEILAFAYRYADRGQIPQEEVGDALRGGRIAAVGSVCLELSELNYLEACFEGEPANIGFPRSEGNGIYATPNMLYVNAGSKGKDGAYEFLRFLVSEEGQRRYVERNRSGGGVSLMPIRLDILDEMTALEMRKAGETTARSATGVLFVKDGFTQEQKERFDRLLEKAEPGNWHAAEIMSIVYEELEPYFAGQRTAAEAAANLDNRVQLYMDERK